LQSLTNLEQKVKILRVGNYQWNLLCEVSLGNSILWVYFIFRKAERNQLQTCVHMWTQRVMLK